MSRGTKGGGGGGDKRAPCFKKASSQKMGPHKGGEGGDGGRKRVEGEEEACKKKADFRGPTRP